MDWLVGDNPCLTRDPAHLGPVFFAPKTGEPILLKTPCLDLSEQVVLRYT